MGYRTIGNSYTDSTTITLVEVGQSFEGTLKYIRQVTTKDDRKVWLAEFFGLDMENYSMFLGTQLEAKITDELLGERLLIVYKGKVRNPKTGRSYNDYDVSVWDENFEEGVQLPEDETLD